MKNLVITTGDWNGIGLEITFKALAKIKIPKNIRLLIYFSEHNERKYYNQIFKKYDVFDTCETALIKAKNKISFIKSNLSPALCFEEAVHLAKAKKIQGIATAPLSKEEISMSGLKDRGHTDIMRRVLSKENISMAFWGKYFSVLLATDHIPLLEVPEHINRDSILAAIQTAWTNASVLTNSGKIRIGVLGLNPHAAEVAGLGDEERLAIIPAVETALRSKIPVFGPLIPDVCFQNPDYKKHSIYIAMYHDQGLIPFKIYHKRFHGIQVSLNLPFVRTSVDHGTAKDIFKKNKADPTSMVLAIQKALQMIG